MDVSCSQKADYVCGPHEGVKPRAEHLEVSTKADFFFLSLTLLFLLFLFVFFPLSQFLCATS